MKKTTQLIYNELERFKRDLFLKQNSERADLIWQGRLFQCLIPLTEKEHLYLELLIWGMFILLLLLNLVL